MPLWCVLIRKLMEQTKDCEFRPTKHGECKCKSVIVNFRRLESLNEDGANQWFPPAADLLHAAAGLCSKALPDMELQTIYACLTGAGSKSVLVIRDSEGVIEERRKQLNACGEKRHSVHSAQTPQNLPTLPRTDADDVTEEYNDPFASLFTDSESEEGSEENNDHWLQSRKEFLERIQQRSSMPQLMADSVGAEHRIVACAAFMRLSSKPQATAAQVTILAVRSTFRRAGVGTYLIECCKDPAVVGNYDVLLTFADHKAERFFARHGFTDDPIITSRYKYTADVFQNSTLMCFITPFSGPGLSPDTLTAIKQANLHMSTWREQASTAYWEQLTFMERLRHELLVVHGRCEVQEEVIVGLRAQLARAHDEKAELEAEFSEYRQRTQKILCDLTKARANQWLADNVKQV